MIDGDVQTMGKPMNDVVRPLRWWNTQQLKQLSHRVDVQMLAWQQAWGLVHTSSTNAEWAELAWETMPQRDRHWCKAEVDLPGVWWCQDSPHAPHSNAVADPILHTLVVAMFGPQTPEQADAQKQMAADIAPDVARHAWVDFWQRMLVAFDVRYGSTTRIEDEPAIATHQFQPWSGGTMLSLPWMSGHTLHILLSGVLADAALHQHNPTGRKSPPAKTTPKRPVTPLWTAVSNLPCVIRVELTAAQVTLGALRQLQVGDVLEVPHPLESPLLAVSEHGAPVSQAHLGKYQNHKAIELLGKPL